MMLTCNGASKVPNGMGYFSPNKVPYGKGYFSANKVPFFLSFFAYRFNNFFG